MQRLRDDTRIRFLAAGGLAALVNWMVRFPLNLVMPYGAAVIVALAIGMGCGFLLYRAWVFTGSQRSMLTQVRDFILVNLVGMSVTLLIALLLRNVLLEAGAGPQPAAAFAHAAGIGAGAVANYLGHRHVTFR